MDASSSDWPLHQLWPPSGDSRRIDMDIVLFHGLQVTPNDMYHAWTSTWTQRGHDNVCWPREWLPCDLGEAVRIFSVSYDAHVLTSSHNHVSEIADNLFHNFVDRRYEWKRPIVLIGHSFGGLVLKSVLVKLKKESTIGSPSDSLSKSMSRSAKMFLKNVRGVAFYAVPHTGSTNISAYVNKLLACKNRHYGEIMANIEPNRRDMTQLSVDFEQIVTENKINIRAFSEGKAMQQLGMLVEFASAQQLARNNCYKVEDANHIEVCKPPSKDHPSYQLLLQLIIICGKVSREFEQAQQEVHDLRQSTFGLDSYVEEVETFIASAGSDLLPKYLGVWGMGGAGKSVLLKTLYARAKVNNHFQGVQFIWRTVGKSPDITSIYRFFSQELGLKPKLDLNVLDYKRRLEEVFKQGRVFLVLDDVWEKQTFESLDLAKGDGSVTLLSTRDEGLLQIASPKISKVPIHRLSEDDSWSLFRVHAFRPPSNVPDELKELSQSMARECAGLPLALKVIGGGMFDELPKQWELQLKKLTESRMHEGPGKELYELLSTGYDLLSDRLKQCFHYFAAFPENSDVVFEEILFHWSGEGLVPVHDGDDARAEAFSLLKQLRQRSFIESNGAFDSDQPYLLDFKLHDVMRDLAFYLLEKDWGTIHAQKRYLYRAGQNLGKIPQELKRLSETPESKCTTISEALRLSLDTNNFKTLPEFYAPKLVLLLLGRNPIVSLPADFSSYFPNLSVLNLRNGQFHSLPDQLGDLKNLVCLDLSNCHELKTLPDTVRKFHKLKFLILDDCWGLKYLPSGVVDLISLQVLHTAHCGRLTWADTARAQFDHLYSTVGASLEDICRLPHLTELTIFADVTGAVMSKALKLPQNELPLNISSLTKLRLLQVCLEFRTFPGDISYRCIQLQELELCSSTLKFLPRSFTACGAFPALTNLNLSCPNLVQFPKVDEGAFPKLQTLDVSSCQSLKSLPLTSLKLLSSLRSFIVENCEWYISEMSSTWEKRDISKSSSPMPWVEGWTNTKRYTFSSTTTLKLYCTYSGRKLKDQLMLNFRV